MTLFIERMRCVPRFLAGRNARLGRILNDQDISDAAQEVLAAIWRKLPGYRGAASLETWAYHFCLREYAQAARRKSSQRRVLGGDGALPDVAEAAEPSLHALDAAAVYDALELLPDEDAAVLRLKHYDGLTFEEIAGRLALSANTAKTRYYRTIEKLRSKLASFHEEAS